MPSPDPAAPPSKGMLPAWSGGALAALGAASLTLLLHGAPLGKRLWAHLPHVPEKAVAVPVAFAAALTAGLAAAWVGAAVHPMKRVAGLIAAGAILTLSQSLVLGLHHIAWEPLPTLLAITGAASIAALLRPVENGPPSWFRSRVSPRTLQRLTVAEDTGFLRPDQRVATVVTCRLLNENALREVLPAREFLKLCETLRAKAGEVLMERGACLDPTEASGVRAFFGLPLPSATAADEAVAAALALDDAMRAFAETHPTSGGAPRCGIGLATGKLTAGLVGETYTVMGDAMELSRWLAAETAAYGVRLLTDSATHFAAERIEDRPLEFVNPPDGAAVEIFHLLGTTGSLSREALARRQAFRDAIVLLRAGHSGDALERFADAREGLSVPDPVLDHFVSLATDQSQRDAASAGQSSANPPAELLRPPPPQLPGSPAPRRNSKPNRKLPRRP